MRRLAATALTLLAMLAPLGCGDSEDGDGSTPPRYGSFFGISPQGSTNEADLARMASGGIGSYHFALNWALVESPDGSYDWSAYDQLLGLLARAGLDPFPYLYGTPVAYAEVASEAPTNTDEGFDAWARFVEAAALRYGPGGEFWDDLAATNPDVEPRPVRTWELWNEPNSSVFWKPKPDPAAYADLLVRSARVLREADPEADVVSGGMFATPTSPDAIESYDFLADIYGRAGVVEAIDEVGVHPYSPRIKGKLGVIDQVQETREVVDDSGDDAGLWVTEIGWGSDPEVPTELSKTPEQQAELLTESLSILLEQRESLGLRGIVWYTWRDFDPELSECGWCPTAGLLDADLDSKPAWIAFTELSGGTP